MKLYTTAFCRPSEIIKWTNENNLVDNIISITYLELAGMYMVFYKSEKQILNDYEF